VSQKKLRGVRSFQRIAGEPGGNSKTLPEGYWFDFVQKVRAEGNQETGWSVEGKSALLPGFTSQETVKGQIPATIAAFKGRILAWRIQEDNDRDLPPQEVVRSVFVNVLMRRVKVPLTVSEEMRAVTGIQGNLKVSLKAWLQFR
jgi:hypothetical protein